MVTQRHRNQPRRVKRIKRKKRGGGHGRLAVTPADAPESAQATL